MESIAQKVLALKYSCSQLSQSATIRIGKKAVTQGEMREFKMLLMGKSKLVRVLAVMTVLGLVAANATAANAV